MYQIKYSEMAIETMKELPEMVPTHQYFVVFKDGKTGVMNDKGGEQTFGAEDWELIKEGIYPGDIQIQEIDITLH